MATITHAFAVLVVCITVSAGEKIYFYVSSQGQIHSATIVRVSHRNVKGLEKSSKGNKKHLELDRK